MALYGVSCTMRCEEHVRREIIGGLGQGGEEEEVMCTMHVCIIFCILFLYYYLTRSYLACLPTLRFGFALQLPGYQVLRRHHCAHP
ncbi:hypothetical protein K491DRAFT_424457 [Lophiostoma macrostomum CBS 122681]|uniref:Uncharacterized protein n=1 Tax=Lophiostoma macrostomum CBS 122681 TaxID=1314788 RepID=A0A6A6T620_9PLEO|nr:hypothetical protein K491DRAFT_424457 [Lophiostoma macrostomum CBS 122681]